MPTNQLLPFGTGGGANVLDYASYQALAARLAGFTAGTAPSQHCNTAWRQSSFAAAMIGQFTVDNSGQDVLDNGDIATFEANFKRAIQAAVPLAGISGSQSYGTAGTSSFVVPAGVRFIFARVWSAGGGGGGASNSSSASAGGGGGEYREGWIKVTPGETLTIVVGAGGAGGTNTGTNGGDGGNSSVTGGSGAISCIGGKHSNGAVGVISNSNGVGGTGGSGGSFVIPGAAGGLTCNLGSITMNGMGGASFGCGYGLFGYGTNGLFPGQGGSGYAGGAGAGGSGAAGRVDLQW